MKDHRVNELMELLHTAWKEDVDLNLLQFLQKLAQESGYEGPLEALSDDTLIYHLKMRGSDSLAEIPGLKKAMKMILKPQFCAPEESSRIDVNLCELHAQV